MMPIAVLAGGLGTRMAPLTNQTPKILLPVAGRPFAEHQIELFKEEGIRRVVYCVSHFGEQVREALGDGSKWGMHFHYSVDYPAAGTGGAIRRALPLLGPAFFVTYGDAYLECNFGAIENHFRVRNVAGLLTVFHNIDYGLGVLTPRAFTICGTMGRKGCSQIFSLNTVYKRLTKLRQLTRYKMGTRYHEIGSPGGLHELHHHLLKRDGTDSPTN